MDICGREGLYMPEGECECPGGGEVTILSYTYSQVKALRDNGELIPGQQYRIKDYEATTTQANTSVVPHSFDIIVTADNETTLNENARAVVRSNDNYYTTNGANLAAWEIKYSIDNDTSRFGWADATNGKGVIYYMKDEHGNIAPYDFKQIVFARYAVESCSDYPHFEGYYTTAETAEQFPGITPEPRSMSRAGSNANMVLDTTPVYFFTFSYLNTVTGVAEDASVVQEGECYDNIIRGCREASDSTVTDHNPYRLPSVVFLHESIGEGPFGIVGNTIGFNSYDITLYNACHNDIGEGCAHILAKELFFNNTIGDECFGLFFGYRVHDNVLGSSNQLFVWDGNGVGNVIGSGNVRVFFEAVNGNNIIGNGGSNIHLHGYSFNNVIGSQCSEIDLGANSSYNRIGEGSYAITTDSSCSNNSFGQLCHTINLESSCLGNSFGNQCVSIFLGPRTGNNTFEDNVWHVELNNGSLSGSEYVQHYYFLTGTHGSQADPINITGAVNLNYTQYVAKDSNGTLKIWNPAD